VASMILIAIAVAAFAFFAVGSLQVHSVALPTSCLLYTSRCV